MINITFSSTKRVEYKQFCAMTWRYNIVGSEELVRTIPWRENV